MGQCVAFVDGQCGHSISGVEHNTGGSSRGVQGQHFLDGHVHGGCVEGFEHDLGHLLPVSLRVEGSFCEQDEVFLGSHTQLIVGGVVPDLHHIAPVGHDTVLDEVLQGEDASLALGQPSHTGGKSG